MSDIYVFSSDDENNDYSTMGLVGALEPTECTFEETANGDSIITMTHPLDEFGKYTALQRDNILVVPVPVRTTPEIQNGSCVTQVWKYKVKPLNQLTSKNQRTLYKKSSGSSRMKIMNAGDVVTVVVKPRESQNISRWKVKSKYGTGWIDPDGFELVEEKTLADKAEAIEEIQSPWSVTDQLFRIQEVEKELTSITVTARHISYDLLYDSTYWYFGTENATTLQNCIDKILSYSYSRPTDTDISNAPFRGHTNVANTQVGFSFRGKNPIECFLDPDEGVCAKFGVDLIRDNHDLYFLASPGINRGVRIQYGKNLTGITYKDNTDEVVTRIIPTGETKSGEELFLAGAVKDQCVDSPKINDYPVIHVYYMKCENCKVGDKDENGGTITTAIAQNRMRAQAKKLYETGVDEPKIEMSVEFVNIGDTEEYSQFKNLENCFLFDYVIVQSPNISVDVTAQIVKMEWDCILDRMNSVEIGTVGKTLANNGITSWQIPSGFSGSKIANGTVSSGSLKENIIAARHIQSDTINANHIQANAVTADKIAANAITASKIEASAITAEKIAADAVEAEKIKAGAVETDKLAAKAVTAEKIAADAIEADAIKAGAITANKLTANSVTAEKIAANAIEAEKIKAGAVETDKIKAGAVTAEKIASKTITADLIAAKTITAESGVIDDAAIGGAQIADGSITSAKIVSLNADVINAGTLSAERLVLVGDDGVIYKINAASSGLSMTELAKDEYKNYINGTVIVARSITAAQIAAQTITGNEILAGSITAKEIDVSDLFASEATIAQINAMDISGNEYLKLAVKDAVDGIEVGGRNLYTGTRDFSGDAWENTSFWTEDGTHEGCTVLKRSKAWNGTCQEYAAEVGEYTLSAWVKSSENSNIIAYFLPPSSAEGNAVVSQEYHVFGAIGTQWKRVSAVIQVTAAGNLRARFENAVEGESFRICGMKLEKGNVATDWSPAPEDAESELGALESRVSDAEMKITSDAIVSTVTSSESYKALSSTANTAKTTAETAKTNAAAAQSTANEAKTAAGTAQSTADTAKTNAAAAQSTANSAQSKADANESGIAALTKRVSEAELKITPSAITATVKENVELGGRNLFLGTRDYHSYAARPWINVFTEFDAEEYNGLAVGKKASAWGGATQSIDAVKGEVYTFSAYMKKDEGAAGDIRFFGNNISGNDEDGSVSPSSAWIGGITSEWQRVSVTFEAVTSGVIHPRFEKSTTSDGAYLYICGLKLEKGNVATDWSPAPEDAADSVYVDSSYSKVEINKDKVRIVSTQMEVAVPSEDGEDDVMRVDADGVHADMVEADEIVSDSVVHTQGAATYTPADAGELAEILEGLNGKHLTGKVTIYCKNITSGAFELQNVSGSGTVRFLEGGTINGFTITNCSCALYFNNVKFSTAGTAVSADNAKYVYFSSCEFNAGLGVYAGSDWIASNVVLANCTGECTQLAKVRYWSRLDCIGSSKPSGTYTVDTGGEIYNATSDPTFTAPSSGEVPEEESVTVSLSPTSTSTSGHSGLGSKLYQGRYTSSQSFRKGVMLFTLPTDLTSADKIDSATLTLKRIAGVGSGASVPVHVRLYDVTGTLYASKNAREGQTISIDVTSAVKAMKTNGNTGLMLYNPDTATAGSKTYTVGYARFAGKGESGEPVLKVSYRK